MKAPYINRKMKAAYEAAREAQDVFWSALTELENVTGIDDINGNNDFRNWELKDLFKADGAND